METTSRLSSASVPNIPASSSSETIEPWAFGKQQHFYDNCKQNRLKEKSSLFTSQLSSSSSSCSSSSSPASPFSSSSFSNTASLPQEDAQIEEELELELELELDDSEALKHGTLEGQHLCFLTENDEQFADLVKNFLLGGVLAQEKILYLVEDNSQIDKIMSYITDQVFVETTMTPNTREEEEEEEEEEGEEERRRKIRRKNNTTNISSSFWSLLPSSSASASCSSSTSPGFPVVRQRTVTTEDVVRSGQVVFLLHSDSYLKDERFDPERSIQMLRNFRLQALEDGYKGFRVTGSPTFANSWEKKHPGTISKVMEFESKLNQFFAEFEDTHGWCQYSEECFSSATLLEVLACHPSVVLGREVYENFYYIPQRNVSEDSQGSAVVTLQHRMKNLKEKKSMNRELRRSNRELKNMNLALQNEMEKRMQAQKEKDAAEALNRAKSQFMATISHEIRTPLTGILGSASLLLQSEGLLEEHRDSVNIIQNCGDHLLAVINDVLMFSRLESGRGISLDMKPLSLKQCVKSVFDMFSQLASERQMTLNYEYLQEIPDGIVGDITRLRQVLFNLVSNAFKFTLNGGSIVITIDSSSLPPSAQTDTETVNETVTGPKTETEANIQGLPFSLSSSTKAIHPPFELLIAVRDTGIGIPKEKFDFIFDSFSQIDSAIERKYEGTGLGLSISKKLVESWHGRIWLESEENEGSTFFFSVPTCGVELPSVLSVSSSSSITNPFLSRGGLNLHQSTAAVRLDSSYSSFSIPSIMNSSSYPGGKSCLRISSNSTEPTESNSLRIMVADDNVVNRRVICKMLERLGCPPTSIVSDGIEAIDEVRRRNEEGLPQFDIILLDLHMPKMSGLEASRIINEMEWDSVNSNSNSNIVCNQTESDLEHEVTDNMDTSSFVSLTSLDGSSPVGSNAVSPSCSSSSPSDSSSPGSSPPGCRQNQHRLRCKGRKPLLVCVSASVLSEDKEQCRQAGFSYHLCKPLKIENLATLLAQFHLKWNASPSPSSSSSSGSGSGSLSSSSSGLSNSTPTETSVENLVSVVTEKKRRRNEM